jgi:hypothetical protein
VPASALTMKQCSEKYKAANAAGGTGGMDWKAFRKAECGRDATMDVKTVKTTAKSGVSRHECSVRYRAAKKDGTLGGMSWNEFRSAGCVAKTAAAVPAIPDTNPSMPADTMPAMPPAKSATAPADKSDGTKVSSKECSVRYHAAKTAGTLNGMSWNEFRHAGCPEDMATHSDSSMVPTSGAAFPVTVSQKYADESPGRARLLTCRDQYEANKAAGMSELKWTERGGGYYSECNKRLKSQ